MTRISFSCPCCGSPVGNVGYKALEYLPMGGQQHRILMLFIREYPKFTYRDAIIDEVYAGRYDGGPENAYATVKGQIWQVNRIIAPYGWVIKAKSRQHGRRLEPIRP